MSDIKTWNTAAGSNTASPPHGAPEGWNPSQVNDWAREAMAAVRRWYDDAQWIDFGVSPSYVSTTQFDIAGGDKTAVYHVSRRVKANVGSGTIYGYINASSYLNPQTRVTVDWDSGALDSSLSGVAVGIITAQNSSLPKTVSTTILTGGDHSVSSLVAVRVTAANATISGMVAYSPNINGGSMSAVNIVASSWNAGTISSATIITPVISGGSWAVPSLTNPTINGGTSSGVTLLAPSINGGTASGLVLLSPNLSLDGSTISGATLMSPHINGGTASGLTLLGTSFNLDGVTASSMSLLVSHFDGGTISGAVLNNCQIAGTQSYGGADITPVVSRATKTVNQTATSMDSSSPALLSLGALDATVAIGTQWSTASSRYTPTSPGNYYVQCNVVVDGTNVTDGDLFALSLRKNAVDHTIGRTRASRTGYSVQVTVASIVNFNGTTDYCDFRVANETTVGVTHILRGTFTDTNLVIAKI